jgi:hypothetical protein
VFSDVFERINQQINLPSTTYNYGISSIQNRGSQELLTYRDGDPYLIKTSKGLGHLYLCSSSLNSEVNDLVKNAEIFIPMLYKMAVSSGAEQQLSYIIGVNDIIRIPNDDIQTEEAFEIISEKTSSKKQIVFIPRQIKVNQQLLFDVSNEIEQNGIYLLRLNEKLISKLAFNYDSKESSLFYVAPSELEERYGNNIEILRQSQQEDFSRIISQQERGRFLWKYFLLFSLVFLGIEQLLLRLWKT